jgi:EmrB/QacA subfamily drug resistance transporter
MRHASTAAPNSAAATSHGEGHGPDHVAELHSHAQQTRQPWTALVLLAVAQFMVILDVTVVNVALPSIGAALDFSRGDLQWVVTAYVLFTGGLMLLGGRLADLLGARRVFGVGLVVFTGASLLSGLASSPDALIVARGIQGIGAAMLLPSALTLITTTYTGPQRTVALGVWGALGSAGAAAGVLLGGVITTALSWEWVFFINVPVGIAVGLSVGRVIPPAPARRLARRQFDVFGATTVMGGLLALVYAISGTSTHGWTSTRTLVGLSVAVVVLGAFAVIERTGTHPLVPASTWRVRSLISSATVMFGATGVLVGTFFLNTLFLQNALDASPLETGLAFLPLALVILVAAHLASHLLSHLGTRNVMAAGLLIAAAGALLLSDAPSDAGYVADLLPGFLALGFGIGLTFVAVSVTAMNDVAHEEAGLASGFMTTGHELGAALGVAVFASVATRAGGGIAQGYGDGFVVAAGVAAVLAVVALVTVPSVRPAAGTKLSMH